MEALRDVVVEGNAEPTDDPGLGVPGIVSGPQPLWLVDCGNFMSSGRFYPELRGQTHMKVMQYLGCKAVVPGHEELATGQDQAESALGNSGDMLVSCNLKSHDDKISVNPYANPAPGWYLIGVSSWEPAPDEAPVDRWWELTDPVEAVKGVLAGLPSGAKSVVFATNQPEDVMEQLAALPLAAVVGYSGEREQWPAGSAPVYPAPEPKGSYVELITMVDTPELAAHERWSIQVSEDWPDDTQVDAMLIAEQDERLERIREDREKKWGKGGYQNIDWGTSEKFLPQKSEAIKAAEQGEAVYVGMHDCAKCHKEEYKKWFSTLHASALVSLKEGGDQDNIDCLACHSTALLEPGGYDPFQQREAVSAVTCESCHGPGSIHALNMQGKGPYKGPDIQLGDLTRCAKCHDSTNSPDFDAEKYWEKIKH